MCKSANHNLPFIVITGPLQKTKALAGYPGKDGGLQLSCNLVRLLKAVFTFVCFVGSQAAALRSPFAGLGNRQMNVLLF